MLSARELSGLPMPIFSQTRPGLQSAETLRSCKSGSKGLNQKAVSVIIPETDSQKQNSLSF
jgi:hypothetical protein